MGMSGSSSGSSSGPPPDPPSEPPRTAGGTVGRGARATARGAKSAVQATRRAGIFTARQARRASQAEGAGDSGLSRLIELHAINAAGDAAIAISLAGTLFFRSPRRSAGTSRPVPRAHDASLRGDRAADRPVPRPIQSWPALGDRLDDGDSRLLMLGVGDGDDDELRVVVPGRFGLPGDVQGVRRDSGRCSASTAAEEPDPGQGERRISLAGVIGATVSAPLAGLASMAGPHWSLRYAFLVFVVATMVAIRLPERVDSSQGEGELVLTGDEGDVLPTPRGRPRMRIPGAVSFALRANCGPRWFSGFLIMFMAFLLRDVVIGDYRPELLLGIVIGVAGLGSTLGIALASMLRQVQPGDHRGRGALGRRRRRHHCRALLRPTDPRAARTDGRTCPVAREAVPRLDDPARRARASPVERVRAVGHHAAVGLGDRRLHRHRDAADSRLGLGVAAAVLALWSAFVLSKWSRTRRPSPTSADDRPSPLTRTERLEARVRRPGPAATLPCGAAVRESGWRPCR